MEVYTLVCAADGKVYVRFGLGFQITSMLGFHILDSIIHACPNEIFLQLLK